MLNSLEFKQSLGPDSVHAHWDSLHAIRGLGEEWEKERERGEREVECLEGPNSKITYTRCVKQHSIVPYL